MQFIEVNGVGLRCELSGSGERTIVLIHEMGGSLESWGEVAPRRAAVLARVDAIERQGMRSVVDESMANGYPPELRANAARFAAFRARWLGNDPASYAAIYRMLAGTDLQAELARIARPVLVL